MSRTYDIVVAGAGAAGIAAAASARATDTACSILLINAEDRPPYLRTQISKHLNEGYKPGQFALHDEQWYADQHIDRLDGLAVQSIDRTQGRIALSDESEPIAYSRLVLATGGDPMFPKIVRPHEQGSFFVLRSAKDGEELRSRVGRARSVLIAGMGVLAVELAQQLSAMGKKVTLAGATPQLIPRQLNARGGEILEDALSRAGVRMLFQEEILSFERNKKNWSVEMLKHSERYDVVVFCIGVEPRSALASEAGLEVDRGIVVDDRFRSSDPQILAAGDCAQLPDGSVSYLWSTAEQQGRIAGINAAGGEAAYVTLPDRLSSSVFGHYVFSIAKPREPWSYEIDEFENDKQYYALYWNPDSTLRGAVMLNDEDYAGDLETAAREGWSRSRVLKTLELEAD